MNQAVTSMGEPITPPAPLNEDQQKLFLTLAPKFKKEGLIKSLLIASGISQKDIAQRYNVLPSEVSKVIVGARKTPHIREAIAKELGLSVAELWSDL
jgi:hypothetical protein